MNTMIGLLPRAVAPCPTWCDMPAGHPYVDDTLAGAWRGHARTVAKWQSPPIEGVRSWKVVIEIAANAKAESEDSPTEDIIDPPLISFYVEGEADDLTATQARDLAAFLTVGLESAAQQLEGVTP